MPVMSDHDAGLRRDREYGRGRRLVEAGSQDDGRPALRLTARGEQVGRAQAVAGENAPTPRRCLRRGSTPPVK
jgi:hypothetical protein